MTTPAVGGAVATQTAYHFNLEIDMSMKGPDNQTRSLRVLRKVLKAGESPSEHARPLYIAALSFAINRLENPEPKEEIRRSYARGYAAAAKHHTPEPTCQEG